MYSTSPPNKSILIVDDNVEVRDLLYQILKCEGYRVSVAANGQEALHYLRNNPPPSLILLDLVMPKMDGWELLARVKDLPTLAAVPIIIISGDGRKKRKAAFEAAAYLSKPLDYDLLLDTVCLVTASITV